MRVLDSDTFVQLAVARSSGLIVSVETQSSNLSPDCTAWSKSAERELGAFLTAVRELFGADRMRQAAEDWLDELGLQETLPVDLNWRSVTVAAAIRLAQRLSGAADVDTRVSRRPSSNGSGPEARAELFSPKQGTQNHDGCPPGPVCAARYEVVRAV